MNERKRRGLDDLISQKPEQVHDIDADQMKFRYTKTIGFKVTEKQYEIYRLYSKYYGSNDLIEKWRKDLEKIGQEKGEALQDVETEIKKRLNR